ncbi:hypothetical protein IWQ47_001573 [Aquimarina sp. EL_43]|uniref:hypothetical protein n=1 Tax=unclassified Aquimarina TaxID=2627091 RepID=UPI0018CB6F55|nr:MULTISPECIES: hypothetical protein [unclassified Aquimarina]MBG6130344.1 hypothetical protein [Aquimarina sp. EL_35]MBG6149124.1 hypothetical protein [Aquimarina sp. EL_32]MBG6168502.1 hypothetical protein [Aquimarina sp. EL_43]
MENGCTIVDAMNTYNIALRIILSKGYKIFLIPDKREEYFGDFCAVKGNRKFIGGDPLRVLGLVSIWENTGDDWQNSHFPKEDVYDEILSRALPDSVEDFNKLTEKDFTNLVADYRLLFEEVLEKEFPLNPTRQEMFHLIDSFYKEE